MKNSSIVEYLEKMKPEIDRIIEKYLPKKITRRWLNSVFGKPRYLFNQKAAQESLLDPAWDFLSRGGKRWRPVLFLLVSEAVGGDVGKVKDFLAIPEIIHNGTIIIDDIEDQGELRRGKPTLHRIFGIDIAVNLGNFLYFLPILIFKKNQKKFKKEVLIKAYQNYVQELINLHLGQGMDIYWHKGKVKEIDKNEYLQMCAFKTGCLSRMAAKMAVILSEGSDQLMEKVGRNGRSNGYCFPNSR